MYSKRGIIETIGHFGSPTIPDFLLEISRETGPVLSLVFPPFIIVSDVRLALEILDSGEKPNLYKDFNKLTRSPTMFSKRTHGEGWEWARKSVAPSFSTTNLNKVLPKLSLKLGELKHVLEKFADEKAAFDIADVLIKFTLDFIITGMLGGGGSTHNDGSSNKSSTQITKEIRDVYIKELGIALKEYTLKQAFSPLRRYMFWLPDYQRAERATVYVRYFQDLVMRSYRETRSTAEIEEDSSIMGHLMRSPYESDIARGADITTFLVAGHDTTAYSLAWILVELARHPIDQKKVQNELDEVICNGGELTLSVLGILEHFNNVIKEGMRLWPVAALGSIRESVIDIPYKDKIIPKGATVVLPFYSIFRTGIKDPDIFLPERWSVTNPDYETLKLMSGLPFSSGKRNCVGQNLAMMELRLVLAHLVHAFTFELVGDVKTDYFLTLKPDNVRLRVHRRLHH